MLLVPEPVFPLLLLPRLLLPDPTLDEDDREWVLTDPDPEDWDLDPDLSETDVDLLELLSLLPDDRTVADFSVEVLSELLTAGAEASLSPVC